MFDIGFAELILLAGLGLIVLGPQRLPKAAAQLGRWVGQARRMSRTLMYQLRQEVDLDDPRPFGSARASTRPGSAGGSSREKPGAAKKQQEDKDADKPEENPDKSEKDAARSETDAPKPNTDAAKPKKDPDEPETDAQSQAPAQ